MLFEKQILKLKLKILERRMALIRKWRDELVEQYTARPDLDEMAEENRRAIEEAGLWEAFEEKKRSHRHALSDDWDVETMKHRMLSVIELARTEEEEELLGDWFHFYDAFRLRERGREEQ